MKVTQYKLAVATLPAVSFHSFVFVLEDQNKFPLNEVPENRNITLCMSHFLISMIWMGKVLKEK